MEFESDKKRRIPLPFSVFLGRLHVFGRGDKAQVYLLAEADVCGNSLWPGVKSLAQNRPPFVPPPTITSSPTTSSPSPLPPAPAPAAAGGGFNFSSGGAAPGN
jgi:hypothetical protein